MLTKMFIQGLAAAVVVGAAAAAFAQAKDDGYLPAAPSRVVAQSGEGGPAGVGIGPSYLFPSLAGGGRDRDEVRASRSDNGYLSSIPGKSGKYRDGRRHRDHDDD